MKNYDDDEAVLIEFPDDLLTEACVQNGLPSSGTKRDKLHRLKYNETDLRKRMKIEDPIDDVEEDDDESTSTPPNKFIAAEYEAIKMTGIEDDAIIDTLIKKRWKSTQARQMKAGDVKEERAKSSTLKTLKPIAKEKAIIKGTSSSKSGKPTATSITKPLPAKLTSPAKPTSLAKPAVQPKLAVQPKSAAKPSVFGKRSEPTKDIVSFSEDDLAFQHAAVIFCSKRMTARINDRLAAQKLKKEHLKSYILAFDACAKGPTPTLVKTFVDQSLYLTDDEADDDDEKEEENQKASSLKMMPENVADTQGKEENEDEEVIEHENEGEDEDEDDDSFVHFEIPLNDVVCAKSNLSFVKREKNKSAVIYTYKKIAAPDKAAMEK